MIDVTPAPSPLLKTLATLARWSLSLLVAAWLVFGLAWGALHWLIVPRIGEFRPLLETKATQLLGVPVRIGSMTAYSSGLIPSFELSQVQLLDAQGREALRLPRILAALSPRSLLRLGFDQLYIERPELAIRRDATGKLFVAGLDFSNTHDAGSGAADWFFSQLEFVIHDGTIVWIDELRGAAPLALRQVDGVVRNRGRHHDMRLDATPPVQWGERFNLRGRLMQPLLSRHAGAWPTWDGQLYAELPRVDLAELRRYAEIGIDLRQGNGAVTAWVDVRKGQLQGAVADVALAQVAMTLGTDLRALELHSVQGRLGGHRLAGGFEFYTEALQFDTQDGLHWPGGHVRLSYQAAQGSQAAQGAFKAEQLDLAALAGIANRLPLAATTQAKLQAYAPQGLVERVQASWQGPVDDVSHYEAKGRVSQLTLAAADGVPGLQRARIEFDLNQSAGKASVSLTDGAIVLPDFFDEPLIPLTQLSTQLNWQIKGAHLAVQLPNLKFGNADAQGEAQIKWESSDPAKSSSRDRFPGLLDMQGALSRADGARVHRYLPTILDRSVRDYVRDAVQAGSSSNVRFKVRGDLYDMPFSNPRQGEFRVTADVKNATFAFVPRSLQSAAELPWPALTQLDGELVIDRAQLQVKGARARIGGGAGVQVSKLTASIPDLAHSVVTVNAQARGALDDGLGLVNSSPVGAMIGQALGKSVANGSADYKLKLVLPIAALEQSTVQGSVTLAGNDIQITPAAPKLSRARGVVHFYETGFTLAGAQARMLGGDVRLEGGSVLPVGASVPPAALPIVIRASGTASAEGLRQAQELGFVARLAQQATGSTAYTAVLGFRTGEPELQVASNLQGLGLSLPAPLTKSAETVLPLRLETVLLPAGVGPVQDRLTLGLGGLASVMYWRDLSGPEPRVTRGSIGIGLAPSETVALPDQGVQAQVNLNALDLDAWGTALSQVAGGSGATAGSAALTYLPTRMAVRARELTVAGRPLHQVVLSGTRDGLLWRTELEAQELKGSLEYRQPSEAGAGRVHARLARLSVAPGTNAEVETLLSEQAVSMPELDIVVEDFELRGKRLGRVEIEASYRGASGPAREGSVREWRLSKFNIITPEAVLTATGNWARLNTSPRRRTALNFKLDMVDGGELLSRFGMKGVIRKARGKLEGQVAWLGTPMSPDYPSMTGAFTVHVESGQFLKADPGIAKLLGVLSLQALPRRLTLDFRDVFSEGFAFDFVRGDVTIEQGIAKTNNLQIKGVNAAVLMEGQADVAKETQDLKVVVVPEINAGTASLLASVINPAVGLGSFLAQFFWRKPLLEATTQEFHIDGAWTDPRITKVVRKDAPGEVSR